MKYLRIICLANSRKLNGRCFAGKTFDTKQWVRPIDAANNGAIAETTMRYENGDLPAILDIVDVPIDAFSAQPHHPEDCILAQGQWKRTGEYPDNIHDLTDDPPQLWFDGSDRVPLESIKRERLPQSLYFIFVNDLRIHVESEKRVRGTFTYNDIAYRLVITDIGVERDYCKRRVGVYDDCAHAYLCLSLSEPFMPRHASEYFCYKLIATVWPYKKVLIEKPKKSYSVSELRQTHPNAYVSWSAGDDIRLRKAIADGKKTKDIAEMMGRLPGAIRSRIKKLGINVI